MLRPSELNIVRIPVLINATNGSKESGEIMHFNLPFSERLKRAGRYLGMLWLAAAICVFIPIVHFLLVPLFFLTGIWVAAYTFTQRSRVESDRTLCPDCKQSFAIPEMKETWPINFVCPNCSRTLWIEKSINA